MRRMVVESSAVNRVGYDRARRVLEIEYKDGDVYHYFNVPPRVLQELLAAPSIGGYVNTMVKGVYDFAPL